MPTVIPSTYWDKKLNSYQQEDWSTLPNYFAKTAAKLFSKDSNILELGCGNGNDSIYFSSLGHSVTATDFSDTGLNFAKHQSTNQINFITHNLTEALPFNDSQFDVVFSSQSLHFFDLKTTEYIFSEINRVLKKNGILAILLNNIRDPEIKDYQIIETDFYQDPNGIAKRYFSPESIMPFVDGYATILLDENGTSHKDHTKGIDNLVRFIGKKL